MKPLPYRKIKQKLERAGFRVVHQRGSHVKFVCEREGKVRTVVVPKHREIRTGTLRTIIRHAELTPDEFDQL